MLAVPGIKDTQCGFKLFSQKAVNEIFSRQTLDGFSFDVELLFLARKLGFKTREVAVNWHDVEGSKVSVFSDSFRMFKDIARIRFRHWHTTNP